MYLYLNIKQFAKTFRIVTGHRPCLTIKSSRSLSKLSSKGSRLPPRGLVFQNFWLHETAPKPGIFFEHNIFDKSRSIAWKLKAKIGKSFSTTVKCYSKFSQFWQKNAQHNDFFKIDGQIRSNWAKAFRTFTVFYCLGTTKKHAWPKNNRHWSPRMLVTDRTFGAPHK